MGYLVLKGDSYSRTVSITNTCNKPRIVCKNGTSSSYIPVNNNKVSTKNLRINNSYIDIRQSSGYSTTTMTLNNRVVSTTGTSPLTRTNINTTYTTGTGIRIDTKTFYNSTTTNMSNSYTVLGTYTLAIPSESYAYYLTKTSTQGGTGYTSTVFSGFRVFTRTSTNYERVFSNQYTTIYKTYTYGVGGMCWGDTAIKWSCTTLTKNITITVTTGTSYHTTYTTRYDIANTTTYSYY